MKSRVKLHALLTRICSALSAKMFLAWEEDTVDSGYGDILLSAFLPLCGCVVYGTKLGGNVQFKVDYSLKIQFFLWPDN